ncbi:hypothetical protein C6P45_002582 [Maudiozyma exigua]|uniref:Ribosomal protein L33 n=1 Tax=Maudiozyma exigua TaxID=34358 RepID=A0A9P6WD21_MAUEX|nr:hypothetical protein C6P45_002582 [Kazachstania exigua]
MAKAKLKVSVIKLISTAATGFSRHITIKRGAPLEAKKRKIPEMKPLTFSRVTR